MYTIVANDNLVDRSFGCYLTCILLIYVLICWVSQTGLAALPKVIEGLVWIFEVDILKDEQNKR